MITLPTLKDELGINASDTSDDIPLTRCLRQAFHQARSLTNRYLHCATYNCVVASSVGTVTAIGHQVAVGDTITLVGTGTNLDGERTVTAVTRDTVSFAFGSALSGTAQQGSLHPRRTVTFAGNGTIQQWVPQHATPWYALTEVAFLVGETWTAQTLGDFSYSGDPEGRALLLESAVDAFPIWQDYLYPSMTRYRQSAAHNVRLTYDAGAAILPDSIEMAVLSIACDLFEREGTGKDVAGISVAGTSKSVFTGTEKYENRYSPDAVFLPWRA